MESKYPNLSAEANKLCLCSFNVFRILSGPECLLSRSASWNLNNLQFAPRTTSFSRNIDYGRPLAFHRQEVSIHAL